MSEFINADCMEYLPNYPDDYFDLAICDPPYGGGGQPMPPTASTASVDDSGKGSTATLIRGGSLRPLHPKSSVEERAGLGQRRTSRTGVSLTTIYAIGISRQNQPTSNSCGEYRRIKSSGAVITLTYRRLAALLYGEREIFPPRVLRWHLLSMRGHRSTETLNASRKAAAAHSESRASIQHKSR